MNEYKSLILQGQPASKASEAVLVHEHEVAKPKYSPKVLRNTDERQRTDCEGVARPSFNASTPLSKFPEHLQICSPNFTNISAIKKKDEAKDPKDVKDVRRMLATPEGIYE